MYSEMKAAYLVHKSAAHDPRAMTGDTVLRLAYENNARIASLFWPRPVGEISPGAYADLVFLDYFPYTPLTAGNFCADVLEQSLDIGFGHAAFQQFQQPVAEPMIALRKLLKGSIAQRENLARPAYALAHGPAFQQAIALQDVDVIVNRDRRQAQGLRQLVDISRAFFAQIV
jgi:hypothetical protein